MKIKEWGVWLAIALLGAYCIYDYTSAENVEPAKKQELKIGYLQITQVFEQFDMKQEMVEKLTKETNNLRAQVDSLAVGIQLLSESIKNEPTEELENALQFKRVQYYNKRQEYEKLVNEKTQAYDQEIVQRLNGLVQEYAETNGYDFIYGADGSGFLMYGEPGYDITQDVVNYLNTKYQGN